MRIFLDTNILLDLLLQRKDAEASLMILNSIERGLYEGILLDISLINVDYIAKKQQVHAVDFLQLLIKNTKIVGVNNALALQALALEHHDFEDALQYISAKAEDCELIVTNDKGFYQGAIKLMSSADFVMNLLK